MRTTLTLDDDVVARLKAEMRRSGLSLKDTVNGALRRGLGTTKRPRVEPFAVQARPLGLRPGLNYDKVGDLLDQIEGPLSR